MHYVLVVLGLWVVCGLVMFLVDARNYRISENSFVYRHGTKPAKDPVNKLGSFVFVIVIVYCLYGPFSQYVGLSKK